MRMNCFRPVSAAFALAAAVLALIALGCSDRDDDTPVTSAPGGGGDTSLLALHRARTDLAGRLDIPALEVGLEQVSEAGWDGCAGVILPGRACNELFGAGIIARFEANGKTYRYHILGGAIHATDFIKGAKLDDGSPLPPELRVDLIGTLAEYARLELRELRLGRAITTRITNIVPARWSSTCPGFTPKGLGCTKDLVPGAIVLILGSDAKRYRYHVGPASGVIATDFVQGSMTMEPDPKTIDVQRAMIADLAFRLSRPAAEIALKSYRAVTWPDGCIGVSRPGVMCTQALVENGFLAILTDASGKEYRYHGAGDKFIAASLEQGATLTDPIVRD